MTEHLESTRTTRNPWAYGLGSAGAFLLLVAVFVVIIPPAHTTTAAGEIVNFPSLYAQYTGVLMLTIVGTGLLIAGTLTAAQDWARRRA